ncbi:MAG: type VII secretion protein EccCb, partial [Actinobacteria bacterium]|nr:type VII secretion protein EccCb [Actinomycetota bacterium]
APIAAAGVMVAVLGNIRYAVFALISPFMVIGTWIEGRRRARREGNTARSDLAVALDRFRHDLGAAVAQERHRRVVRHPDPAAARLAAATPTAALWQRRRDDPEALSLYVGQGDVAWSAPMVAARDSAPEALEAAGNVVLERSPVVVDLTGGRTVGVVGDRDAALAVVRSLVCQAATHLGPADLRIVVLTTPERAPAWRFVAWLPHAGPGAIRTDSSLPPTGTDDGRATLVVVDGDGLASGRTAARLLQGGASAVVVAALENQLPAATSEVIEVGSDGDAGLWARAAPRSGGTGGSVAVPHFLAAGVPSAVASAWSRELAPFADAAGADEDEAAPLHGAALLGPDAFDSEALARRWKAGQPAAAPVGLDELGAAVAIELPGAHAVMAVVGPPEPGVGVVQQLLAGWAVSSPPERMRVALVDLDRSGALETIASLPHVALSSRDITRSLRAVEGAWRRQGEAGDDLLVVVVHGSLESAPAARDLIGRIAQRPGRTRLVLSAEGPPGVGETLTLELDGAGATGTLREGERTPRSLRLAPLAGPDPGAGRPVLVEEFPPSPGPRPLPQGFGPAEVVAATGAAVALGPFAPAIPLDEEDLSAAPAEGGIEDLLGVGDISRFDPALAWERPRPFGPLTVPLGSTDSGRPLLLDLQEAAVGGVGPHGLLVGATGSGKSELLRTLVLGLVLTHPPDELSLVLVDFKGGATFAGLAELPHVAGMITNLENDPALVDRMREALGGEQRRRQELLRDAGNVANLRDYARRRAQGPSGPLSGVANSSLDPLPTLLVVVDEFAELLTQEPEFVDLFVSIGRLGRSLGIHLLLASQRLEEGRLRGLESHLSYRLALRTFSAVESRTVIGSADAHTLPSEPGWGYLKVDTTGMTRFHAAYAGGRTKSGEGSFAEAAVRRLRDAAPRTHQIWLPTLPPVVPLSAIPPAPASRPLAVAIGLVDRPAEQAMTPLVVDLAGAEGNLAVVGAPQTGKSTVLRTLLLALLQRHTPAEVQVYAIDYGGGGLAALAGAPHVGAVAGRAELEKVRRVVAEIEGVLVHRERLFDEHGIDSPARLREMRAAGLLPTEVLGDVLLVIDNWPALRAAMEPLEPVVLDLAARGLGYGIHVVVTANRWMDLRPNIRDSLGGRLELRLNDPGDSLVDRRLSQRLPAVPGRGLTSEKLQFQVAVPRLDEVVSDEQLGESLRAAAASLASSWTGPPAPPVRLLPAHVGVTSLPAPGTDHHPGVPIGISERDLGPVYLDLGGADPHFLVFGDSESGKTTLLRTFAATTTARLSRDACRFVVIDYRRTLLDAVPASHLLGYAGAAPGAVTEAGRVRELMTSRLPPADITPEQLRARSWWEGPELFVVVDDYDLVVTPAGNPLAPLVEFLAQGRDLGLHLLLARRAAGASRALFEPVLQRVRDLGSPGMLLSGDRAEGPLLGPYRPTEQPPGRGILVRRR